jgi:hypothetical protein
MAATQTMISSSIFQSPFRDPTNDPEAFGSYTSCQGPSAKPQTSPVAKFRKHLASAFASRHVKNSNDFLTSEPVDPNIISLPFLQEETPISVRACSAPPKEDKFRDFPSTSDSLEPFGAFGTNLIMSFIEEDVHKQDKPNQKLRHFSSRATLAGEDPSASSTHLLEDGVSTRPSTPNYSRPTTAAGVDGGHSLHRTGQTGASGCQCPYSGANDHFCNAKLCKCACSCQNYHCKSRTLPKKILRMWENHGFATRHSNNNHTERGEDNSGDEGDL